MDGKAPTEITAIVVSYNSAEVLAACIVSLREHLSPGQVIVVDNASRDGSVELARDLGADVIANSTNVGFGAACNLGAQAATNDILVFVNPDVSITSADPQEFRKLLARRPFGLVGPRTLTVGERGHQEPSLQRALPWPFRVAREALGPVLPREISIPRSGSLNPPRGPLWLTGAVLICARCEFVGLDGFDERLFLYYEDMELSRRYQASGLPIAVTDAICGRHALGRSSGSDGTPSPTVSAASAMSSIEVVGISNGMRSARRAWTLFHALRRLATALLWLTSRGPIAHRSQRKLQEFRTTQAASSALLTSSGKHYPYVRKLSQGVGE